MEMLLQALRGFFRRVHLDALNQGPLIIMVSLIYREQTCMEIVTDTGYDRTTVRQILQRLRQQGDVELRPYRSSGHGQVEYIYNLTTKGFEILKRCLEEFDPLMARLALEENAAALEDAGKKLEKEKEKPGKEEKKGGEGENGKSDVLFSSDVSV